MQFDREPDPGRPVTDADVLDLGVQDTGRDGASWALANRGVDLDRTGLREAGDLVEVWSVRGAPHFYRRAELRDVHTAVSPFDDADAGRRIFDANRPLKAAGIGARQALRHVAELLREIVETPTVKGDASGELSARLEQPYLRDCRPCKAIHTYEIPFRLGATYAGLELEPGTSPPVLRRVTRWPKGRVGPAEDPLDAPPRLQPIRAYLHLAGPATTTEVAAFLDTSVTVIKQHWPQDAVPVRVGERTAYLLEGDIGALDEAATAPTADERTVRLVGSHDLLMQVRDRETFAPDPERRKALYAVLGRPGPVVVDGAVVGTWRASTSRERLTVSLDPWARFSRPVQALLDVEAERLAAHRGLSLAGVTRP